MRNEIGPVDDEGGPVVDPARAEHDREGQARGETLLASRDVEDRHGIGSTSAEQRRRSSCGPVCGPVAHVCARLPVLTLLLRVMSGLRRCRFVRRRRRGFGASNLSRDSGAAADESRSASRPAGYASRARVRGLQPACPSPSRRQMPSGRSAFRRTHTRTPRCYCADRLFCRALVQGSCRRRFRE